MSCYESPQIQFPSEKDCPQCRVPHVESRATTPVMSFTPETHKALLRTVALTPGGSNIMLRVRQMALENMAKHGSMPGGEGLSNWKNRANAVVKEAATLLGHEMLTSVAAAPSDGPDFLRSYDPSTLVRQITGADLNGDHTPSDVANSGGVVALPTLSSTSPAVSFLQVDQHVQSSVDLADAPMGEAADIPDTPSAADDTPTPVEPNSAASGAVTAAADDDDVPIILSDDPSEAHKLQQLYLQQQQQQLERGVQADAGAGVDAEGVDDTWTARLKGVVPAAAAAAAEDSEPMVESDDTDDTAEDADPITADEQTTTSHDHLDQADGDQGDVNEDDAAGLPSSAADRAGQLGGVVADDSVGGLPEYEMSPSHELLVEHSGRHVSSRDNGGEVQVEQEDQRPEPVAVVPDTRLSSDHHRYSQHTPTAAVPAAAPWSDTHAHADTSSVDASSVTAHMWDWDHDAVYAFLLQFYRATPPSS